MPRIFQSAYCLSVGGGRRGMATSSAGSLSTGINARISLSSTSDYHLFPNYQTMERSSDGGESSTAASTLDLKGSKTKGLSIATAAVFIVGEMAGSGILALPKATAQAGWFGLPLIIICCWASAKSCVCLAESWLMIERKWPEFRQHCRDPFPTIGEQAVGRWMKTFCSVTMDIQLFGAALVFLLLCAELAAPLVGNFVSVSFCNLIIIVGLILCPLMWLGSPQDFSPVAFGAMASTGVSCIIILIILVQESAERMVWAEHRPPNLRSFLLGLSTILFAFGGAVTLPTFQNDMARKEQFPVAVFLGFTMMLAIYLPIALGGYVVIGDLVTDNILESFNSSTLTTAVNIFMAFHVFCAFLIVVNPLNLDLEQHLNVKHSCNLKRSGMRALICGLLVFTGLSIPRFGKVLNLVGASTVTLQTFILPPWFYVKLVEKTGAAKISKLEYIHLSVIGIFGVAGMIIGTYFSVQDLFGPNSFTIPCYCNSSLTLA